MGMLHERLRVTLLGEARPPRRLGRFELRTRIGSGGMGTVYEGWDPHLSRPVALKLLRLDGRLSQARLRHEAHVLARLKHRHIVTVFDIGSTDDRVYVAMERIDGCELNTWFETRPHWRAVVRAFGQAARALAYAHDEGVVHGDIKPSNLLLDAQRDVKLIDFGLAQLREEAMASVAAPVAAGDSTTGVGGTLGYAAPEKLRARADSPAADIFSLSVALYEGLNGERPFPNGDSQDFDDAVGHGAAPIPGVPRAVGRIVQRGLAHDPEDRWSSAHELASALERTLQPRRWWPLAAGVGVAIFAGVGGWSMRRAAPGLDCDRAGASAAARWQDARDGVQAPFSGAGQAYLVDSGARVVGGVDDYVRELAAAQRSACNSVTNESASTPRDAVARCLQRRERSLFELVTRLSTEPSERTLRGSVSAVYALPPVEDCADSRYLATQFKPPDDLSLRGPVAALMSELQSVHPMVENAEFAKANARLSELLEQVNALGFAPLRVEALQTFAVVTSHQARYEESLRYSTEAFFLAREHHLEVRALKIASNLVGLHTDRGDYEEALRWGRHAESLLVDSPDPIVSSKLHYTVSITLQRLARFDEAQTRLERALQIRENALGPDHFLTADARFELGTVALQQDRLDIAREQIEQARGDFAKALGPRHPGVATANNNLGLVFAKQGDLVEAERVWRECLEIREQAFGPEHPSLSSTLANIALVVVELGRPQEALPLAQRGLAIRQATLGDEHPAVGRSLMSLAEVHEQLGQLEAAENNYRDALATLRHTLDDDHPEVENAAARLSEVAAMRESGR